MKKREKTHSRCVGPRLSAFFSSSRFHISRDRRSYRENMAGAGAHVLFWPSDKQNVTMTTVAVAVSQEQWTSKTLIS